MDTLLLEQGLAEFVAQIEGVAEYVFDFAISSRQPLPSRELVESGAKRWMYEVLEPIVRQRVSQGMPIGEAELCRTLISDRVQVAFQTKWTALARRYAEQVASAGQGEVLH